MIATLDRTLASLLSEQREPTDEEIERLLLFWRDEPEAVAQEPARPQLPFREWFDRFVWVLSKDEADVKAELWPGQEKVLAVLEDEDVLRAIILKGRQLGVSTILAAYVLWHAQGGRGRKVLLSSAGEREAKKLLAKCKYVWRRLPPEERVAVTRDNDAVMEFGSLDSGIEAIPASSGAGRGDGTTLVVADEWGFHPNAEDNWTAVQPTMGKRAKFIGLSTANGRGNFFHRMWEGAEHGINGFTALFLSWREAPGRDAAWYAQQKQEYAATPHKLAQEHPDSPAEAFVASGHCMFNVDAIYDHLTRCTPPRTVEKQPGNGELRIWRAPEPDQGYVVAADVASGLQPDRQTLDACAAAVYDTSARCVATLHGRWEPHVYARLLFELGVRYGTMERPALLAVESNNHGSGVITALREAGYRNLYVAPPPEGELSIANQRAKFGWETTTASKPMVIATLQSHVAGGLACLDQALYDEMLNFVDQGAGKMGAQPGTHDDRVICHAIALHLVPRVRALQAFQSIPFSSPMEVR